MYNMNFSKSINFFNLFFDFRNEKESASQKTTCVSSYGHLDILE